MLTFYTNITDSLELFSKAEDIKMKFLAIFILALFLFMGINAKWFGKYQEDGNSGGNGGGDVGVGRWQSGNFQLLTNTHNFEAAAKYFARTTAIEAANTF